jgi:hypothetical protein
MSESQQTPGQYPQVGQPYGAPGQQYPQAPQLPSQQYPQPPLQPGRPYGAPALPGSTAGGNSLGRIAFIVALASLLVSTLAQLASPFLYSGGSFEVAGAISSVVNIVVVAACAAALVLGLVALRRPAPHLLAAIAIGIGGAGLVVRVVSWVSNQFFYFL